MFTAVTLGFPDVLHQKIGLCCSVKSEGIREMARCGFVNETTTWQSLDPPHSAHEEVPHVNPLFLACVLAETHLSTLRFGCRVAEDIGTPCGYFVFFFLPSLSFWQQHVSL